MKQHHGIRHRVRHGFRCGLAVPLLSILVGNLVLGQPAMAVVDPSPLPVRSLAKSMSHLATPALPWPAAVQAGIETGVQRSADAAAASLTLSLTNDGPTTLGQETHLDAMLDLTSTTLSQWQWLSTTASESGNGGVYGSLAIGADGLPVFSYNGTNNLTVGTCVDARCTSATYEKPDSGADLGLYTALAIGADGLPVISYRDNTNGDLKVAKCLDAKCVNSLVTAVDSADDVGWHTALAIGDDGAPVISYYDQTNGNLKVAKCQDADCTSAISITVDSAGILPVDSAIAVGVGGLPVLSYFDGINKHLNVAQCQDADCTSVITTTVDGSGLVGGYSAIAVGSDGLPIISYFDGDNSALKVAKCLTVDCTSAISTTLDNNGFVGMDTSLKIGADGLPIISYNDATDAINGNYFLKVAQCQDIDCTSAIVQTIDKTQLTGFDTSLAIGDDGLPMVLYRSANNPDLKVAKAAVLIDYTFDYGDGHAESNRIDGLGTHVLSATHIYAAAGTYAAILTATVGTDTGAMTSAMMSAVTIRPFVPPPPKVLSVTLSNDSPTLLGQATHLSASVNVSGTPLTDWQWMSTTVKDTGWVDFYSSIAIAPDGFPVISYQDAPELVLKVTKCHDAGCNDTSTTTVDPTQFAGFYTSLAIGANGLPVIAYYDGNNAVLKLARCHDAGCKSASLVVVDDTPDVAEDISLAIGVDGLPIMSYFDYFNDDLKVAKCLDANCSGVISTTLDSTGIVGYYTSLAIGADGLPVISYLDNTNWFLKVAKCQNVDCTSASTTVVDASGNAGDYTSLAIGADGLPIISYQDFIHNTLKVAKCLDASCAGAVLTTVDSQGAVGFDSALAIGVDGLPVISYLDGDNTLLKVARCHDMACTSSSLTFVDASGVADFDSSLAIGIDGLPVISYQSGALGDLKIAKATAPATVTLNFGDGITTTQRWEGIGIRSFAFTHTYGLSGTYTAVITVSDGISTSTVSRQVAIFTTPAPPPPARVVTLTSDAPTVLGVATQLTVTRSAGLMLAGVSYVLDYGDGSPMVMGTMSSLNAEPLVFTHAYPLIGNYTATITVSTPLNTNVNTNAPANAAVTARATGQTQQDANAAASPITATTSISILANNGIIGSLSQVLQDQHITYTLMVTNTDSVLPATNVVLSGSVPAHARLVDALGAISFATGGDFGRGYAQLPAPVTLGPGESATLKWVVEIGTLTGNIATLGHIRSDSATLQLAVEVQIYRIFLPVIRRNAALLN